MAQLEWHALHTCFGQPLFPYDYPETPSGMTFALQHYTSPFLKQPSLLLSRLCKARDALVAVYATALQQNASQPLLPVERDASTIRSLLPKPSMVNEMHSPQCSLIPVNVKVNGRGSISLPCAIRRPTKQDLELDRSGFFIYPEAVGSEERINR